MPTVNNGEGDDSRCLLVESDFPSSGGNLSSNADTSSCSAAVVCGGGDDDDDDDDDGPTEECFICGDGGGE